MSKAAAGKAVAATIRLVIPAGQAKPSPPVGPALGQAGLKIMDFCKDFNAKTAHIKDDVPIPVVITAYADKTFDYVTRSPPATYFLKKASGASAGSAKPGHQTTAAVSLKHVFAIAEAKSVDTPGAPLEAVVRSVVGTARSMGIRVVARPDDA